jgi:alpha-mannosidase
MPVTLHLIGNAHLDPVWSWDWREGLNEGISTCRAILDLMDDEPDLTYIRGESVVYQHVERHDPAAFARIRVLVAAGRWDPVGGMVVQSDSNLASTETLLHSLRDAQAYFRSRFGRPVRAAWLPDSFGHSAGLPEILAAAGIDSFAFTRGGTESVRLGAPAFWWEGPGGSRVLAYRPLVGWYGCERDSIPGILDSALAASAKERFETVGVFYGLGNHGGGPSRRHVRDIRAWAAVHPEVTVRFSTLHGYMDALREVAVRAGSSFPLHRGELNFCLRGCYSSLGRFKAGFRRTEALVNRAERTSTIIGEAYGRIEGAAGIRNARAGLAFNSFHDILPGTMIERAMDDQQAWLGGAWHRAQRVENDALLALAGRIDTTVRPPGDDLPAPVPLLAWNPHPVDFEGPLEMEAALDTRPITRYKDRPTEMPVELRDHAGRVLPFQAIASEGLALPEFAWRRRIVSRVSIPAGGWRLFTLGWREGARVPGVKDAARAVGAGRIDNGIYAVSASVGRRGITVTLDGRKVLGGAGLHAVTLQDPWGSWGGMADEPASADLAEVVAHWTVTGVQVLERGPERAALWVRMEGGRSWMELGLSLSRGRRAVDVNARVLWNERSSRLVLVMPCGARAADFEVPGAVIRRLPCGEVPGGRWVRARGETGPVLGFTSDSLYSYSLKGGALRVTVARAARFCDDRAVAADAEPWTPAADCGDLRVRFVLSPGDDNLPRISRELEEPPVVIPVPAGPGDLPRAGSLLQVKPAGLRVVTLCPALEGSGVILTVQAAEGRAGAAAVTWLGETLRLGAVPAGRLVSWRLARREGRWTAAPASALE